MRLLVNLLILYGLWVLLGSIAGWGPWYPL